MSKTTGLVITIVTGVLFGCPGLLLLAFGIIGLLPSTEIQSTTDSIQIYFVFLLFGVILVIVPIAVGFFALRTKPDETVSAPRAKSEGPASNKPLSPD